jgi:hypothetical protein
MRSASAARRHKRPDMARRSYLQRIAEPLRARDPVLFAVRGAGPDEARPAVAPAVPDTATPANAATARGTPPRTSALAPVTTAPAPRRTVQVDEAPATMETVSGIAETLPSAMSSPGKRTIGDAPQPPTIAAMPETEILRSSPRADSFGEIQRGTPDLAPITPAAVNIDNRPPSARRVTSTQPAVAQTSGTAKTPPADEREDVTFEPIVVRPPSTTASTRTAGREAAAPRIHIGTVEVRSAAPPPTPVPPPAAAPAAPRADAGPIARAYAWRFGLVQG